MAATALQLNPDPLPVQCYDVKVQELTEVFNSHSLRFRRIAVRQLSNVADAEDAVQDAFVSALTHLQQFRGEAKMSTWLMTIVVNSVRMKLRKRLTSVRFALHENDEQQECLEKTVMDRQPNPEELCRKREIGEALARASSRLSPTLRRAFQLRNVYGLSIGETAGLLGVPIGTVKARLARARTRLRGMVGESTRRERSNEQFG